MDKILRPFIHFLTYCMLYSVTFITACALISLTFWTSYLEVIQHVLTIGAFTITVLTHLICKLHKELEK
jgi:hypothetical protein